MLEMDRLERMLVNLPLLQDPSTYVADTVDLADDVLARQYWLSCFEEALDGVRTRCGGEDGVMRKCTPCNAPITFLRPFPSLHVLGQPEGESVNISYINGRVAR